MGGSVRLRGRSFKFYFRQHSFDHYESTVYPMTYDINKLCVFCKIKYISCICCIITDSSNVEAGLQTAARL